MPEVELLNLLRPRALRWLAQREQSEAELRRKLGQLARTLLHQAAVAAEALTADTATTGIAMTGASAKDIRPACPPASPLDALGNASACVDTSTLEPVIDTLIDWLRERHYLSNQRFVESRMRTRQNRFGMQRIQQELSQHGLSLGEAERQHLSETELQRAHALWVRKFGAALPEDATARARHGRFLMQRGFSSEVIRRVLKGEGFAEADPS